MDNQTSPQGLTFKSDDLCQLAEKLLSESWAKKNDLGSLSIEQIGASLEEGRDFFEKSDDLSAAFLRERASFELCIEHYCALLIWADTNGSDLSAYTLNSLVEPNLRHDVDKKPAQIPNIHSEKETAILWGKDDLATLQPTHEPNQKNEFAELVDALSDINEWRPTETSGQPHGEDIASAQVRHDVNPIPQEQQNEKDSQQAQSHHEPIANSMNPEQPTSLEEEATSLFEPKKEWKVLHEGRNEDSIQAETALSGVQAIQTLIYESFDPPHALTHKKAREFWILQAYFKKQESTWPLEKEYLYKLIGQNICFSIEIELVERLGKSLKTFWQNREFSLRQLLNHGSRKFELHPSLKEAISESAGLHYEWLPEGQFPFAAVLTSLRYMLATLQEEKFQPSLMESGILIFFFGQKIKLGGFSLQNLLQVEGLKTDEITELFFRLCRFNRSRAKVLGAATPFGGDELSLLIEDGQALVALLERLHIGSGFSDREAA